MINPNVKSIAISSSDVHQIVLLWDEVENCKSFRSGMNYHYRLQNYHSLSKRPTDVAVTYEANDFYYASDPIDGRSCSRERLFNVIIGMKLQSQIQR